jgi:excisionase family DNA binding protein
VTLDDLRASGRATITVEEAGAVLGVGRSTAYEAVRAGELPSLKLGRRVLIPVPKLLALLGVEQTAESIPSDAPAPDDLAEVVRLGAS